MFRQFTFIFIASLLMICCKSSITEPTKPPHLLPLAIGNKWNFVRSYFDSLANVTQSHAESLLIIGDTTIEANIWFYHNYFGHYRAFRNDPTGVLVRLVSPNTTPTVRVTYKYPTLVRDSFAFPVVYFQSQNAWIADTVYQCSVIAVDTSITVPAGTYACVQYRITSLRYPDDSWQDDFLSSPYGWIRTEFYSRRRIGGPILKANSLDLIKLTRN